MSSGSWMMPRPSSQAQTRLTMLRVNQGFFGVISQSAKTSRGSRSGDNCDLGPVGKHGRQRRRGDRQRGVPACGAGGGSLACRPRFAAAFRRTGMERIPEDIFLLPLARGLVADLREEDRHARQTVLAARPRPAIP